jgi:hypothetical protein
MELKGYSNDMGYSRTCCVCEIKWQKGQTSIYKTLWIHAHDKPKLTKLSFLKNAYLINTFKKDGWTQEWVWIVSFHEHLTNEQKPFFKKDNFVNFGLSCACIYNYEFFRYQQEKRTLDNEVKRNEYQ